MVTKKSATAGDLARYKEPRVCQYCQQMTTVYAMAMLQDREKRYVETRLCERCHGKVDRMLNEARLQREAARTDKPTEAWA